MSAQTQDVLDSPNKNTLFMVWKFSTSDKVDEVFQRICALIVNLDNSAASRFPNATSNIVMGVSRKAWD